MIAPKKSASSFSSNKKQSHSKSVSLLPACIYDIITPKVVSSISPRMYFIAKLMDPWCLLFVVGVPLRRASAGSWRGRERRFLCIQSGQMRRAPSIPMDDKASLFPQRERTSLPAASQEQLVDKDVIIMSLLVVAPPFPHLSTRFFLSLCVSCALAAAPSRFIRKVKWTPQATAQSHTRGGSEKIPPCGPLGNIGKLWGAARRSSTHAEHDQQSHVRGKKSDCCWKCMQFPRSSLSPKGAPAAPVNWMQFVDPRLAPLLFLRQWTGMPNRV